jgi:hypothetical protein
MDQTVIDFFKVNAALEHNKDMLVPPAGITNDTEMFFKWIRHDSKCKSLRLDVNADVSEIKEEIKNKVELAIAHRGHPGWRSLTLFGYSSVMTNSSEYYKEKSMITEYDTPDWTDVSKFFPKTVAWLKTHNPLTDFVRIRLMILDPGGSSSPHKDYPYGQMLCGPLNIAIINPPGAQFVLEDGGTVPWAEGDFRSMDLGSNHCIRNTGNSPRVHVIITPSSRDWGIEAKALACRSYLKNIQISKS